MLVNTGPGVRLYCDMFTAILGPASVCVGFGFSFLGGGSGGHLPLQEADRLL